MLMLESTVRDISTAWRRNDLAALMKHIADDCVYSASVGPEPGETFVGKDAVRAGFAKLLAHDSASVSEPGEVRAGNDWAVSTWGFRNKGVVVRGCDIWQFRDGLVTRKDS